jgi:glycosyltransferase involved in cell wall biosynthesis
MIILQHHNGWVKRITQDSMSVNISEPNHIARQLIALANTYPEAFIIWCEEELYNDLDIEAISLLCRHKRMMHSYGHDHFLNPFIGFVEDSPFVNVCKAVGYPTWLMHSAVGVVHASVLNVAGEHIKADNNFDYFLTSIAKCLMPQGLFCYSSPQLLNTGALPKNNQTSNTHLLFRFVKQHYKTRWTFFLLVCFILYKKQFPLWHFITCQFYKKRQVPTDIMEAIPLKSSFASQQDVSIDVVIPTIGRKAYLYDVLQDLRSQTVLPKKVIVIEQNPDECGTSDLDYLYEEIWPFKVKHIFTHRLGACNARNLGFREITSNLVFLADDDIRFQADFFAQFLVLHHNIGSDAYVINCIQENRQHEYSRVHQTSIFGSGCSIIKSKCLNFVQFDTNLEFGYGEDAAFGFELRNHGFDVIYFPRPVILHLKANSGGFRTIFKQPWSNDLIEPKPSPTLMCLQKKYASQYQIRRFKTLLFLKNYKGQSIINPIKYIKHMSEKWISSEQWANYLMSKHNTDKC